MYQYRARVIRVIDGDTVELSIDLGFGVWKAAPDATVRLYGPDPAGRLSLNAPERGTPAGDAARAFLTALLAELGSEVVIETKKDTKEKYGRWLAVIRSSDGKRNVNAELVAAGHAKTCRY